MNQQADDINQILVIEDDPDTQDILCDILSGAGYDPMAVPDGESGLELAENTRPGLILLDLMLPGIDGVEVCRRLSASDVTRGIPIIILTARHELPVKLSSFMAGAKRFLTKPFETDVLLNEIHRTIRQASLGDTGYQNHTMDPRD